MDIIIVKYFHFLTIMALSTSLVALNIKVSKEMTVKQFRKTVSINTFYNICMLLTLITGLLLWFVVGKSAEYYNLNWLFHTKLTIFAVMVALSINSTIFFIKNRKTGLKTIKVPKSIILLVRIELILLVILPLIAVLIANGFGSI